MSEFRRKSGDHYSILRCRIHTRVTLLQRCILRALHRFLACSGTKPGANANYTMLAPHAALPSSSPPPLLESAAESGPTPVYHANELDTDLVNLKISLLGDCQIGKTSFLVKYVGNEKEEGGVERKGPNQMDKTMVVSGARISYCIWEVQGDGKSQDQLPMACKDSVAILIMFDLTSRCTLNSVVGWYKEARKWNQTAIPVLIGTKFDDFIQLPIDMQWTIASEWKVEKILVSVATSIRVKGIDRILSRQRIKKSPNFLTRYLARAYAKALNATLFFSSATYNINVNKIFKFITAKLFDLPWTVERNLNVGEPIIDF